MSGEGVMAAQLAAAKHDPVLADVIAYLAQRRDNAAAIVGKSPEFAEAARDRRRQLEVIIDELRAGLHEGSAAVREALNQRENS